jgi:hypothetical protein
VPAVLGVEGLADLVFLQPGDGGVEFGDEGAGPVQPRSPPWEPEPGSSEVTCAMTREVLTLQDALADRGQLLADRGVVGQLGGLHEDVADVHLVLDGLLTPPRISFSRMM